MPYSVQVAVSFTIAHVAKSASNVERRTRGIVSHHLRLQSPIAFALGIGDQASDQRAAQALPSSAGGNIDADLSDAGRASRIRNRCERCPSDDTSY